MQLSKVQFKKRYYECVHIELLEVPERFFDLRNELARLVDIDALITSLVRIRQSKIAGIIAESRIHQAMNAARLLVSVDRISELLGGCMMGAFQEITHDPSMNAIKEEVSVLNPDTVVTYSTCSALMPQQRCQAIKVGCSALLDVARKKLDESISDITEYIDACSSMPYSY